MGLLIARLTRDYKVLAAIKAANVPHYYVCTDLEMQPDRKVIAVDYAAKIGFYIAGSDKSLAADITSYWRLRSFKK